MIEKQKEVEAIIQAIEEESASFKRMSEITKGLLHYSKQLESQVTSLTEERDELKEKLSVRLSFTAVMENKNKVISDLEALLSKAEEENKKLKFGKPIEDAPTDGTPVLAWKTGSSFQPFTQHCEDGVWGRLTSAMGFEPSRDQPDRFIYLPVTSPNDLAAWRPDLLKSKGEEE